MDRPRAVRGLSIAPFRLLLFDNILCSRSFITLHNIEGHPITFFERFNAPPPDRGLMHKYILAAVLLDKTETF